LNPAVSSTAAVRFAARVRRRRRRRVAVAAAALVCGLVLGWLVFASPLFVVRDIQVRGVHRLTAADVAALVSGQLGRSMAFSSPQTAADRVARLRLVRSVHVDRRWPSTLVVTVTEREPIVSVPSAGGRVDLVDGDGIVVDTVSRPPAGLPRVEVDVQRAGVESLRAARAAVDDVPAAVRAGLRAVRVTSPDAVSFVLGDGSTVIWGSAQDGVRKAAALLAVHPKPSKRPVVVDVSAPDAPAVNGG
jgi:cell division protein FtsQ